MKCSLICFSISKRNDGNDVNIPLLELNSITRMKQSKDLLSLILVPSIAINAFIFVLIVLLNKHETAVVLFLFIVTANCLGMINIKN